MAGSVFRWCAQDAGDELTAIDARDALVRCFEHAHRETFTRANERLGRVVPDEAELSKQVTAAVRAAVREVGGDWDAPTERVLRDVVELLADRVGAWGTPADIVAHHRAEIELVIQRAF